MKIVNRHKIENVCTCENCRTELMFDIYDLRWTHCEEDYYYIECPICGEHIWLKRTEALDKMYDEGQKGWDEYLKSREIG